MNRNGEVVGSNDSDEDLDCYYRMFIDYELFDEIYENPDSRWWVDSNYEDYENERLAIAKHGYNTSISKYSARKTEISP